MIKLTAEDIVELNTRMIKNHDIEICFSSGMAGEDLDVKNAAMLAEELNNLLSEKLENK